MQNCCVVIPFYNEAERFDLATFRNFVVSESNFVWILVNDGSSDSTGALLDELSEFENRVFVIQLSENRGKANAVQTGVLYALTNYSDLNAIGFLDADFAVSLHDFKSLYRHFLISNKSLVFYSKYHKEANARSLVFYRRILGNILSKLNRWVLKLQVSDTQCGAKIFSPELANYVFKEWFISAWLFDLEIFFRTIRYFGKQNADNQLLEVPLKNLVQNGSSTLVLKSFFRLPLEYFRIVRHYQKNA